MERRVERRVERATRRRRLSMVSGGASGTTPASLATLVTEPRRRAAPAARGEESGEISWEEFRAAVVAARAALRAVPAPSCYLYCADPYHFAVGLLALWHAGKAARLVPSLQRVTAAEIGAEGACLLTDLPASAVAFSAAHTLRLPLAEAPRDAPDLAPLPLDATLLQIYTSGSTGRKKRVEKSLRNLDAEVSLLEELWGEELADCEIVSTVSHQHIYGLLFRLLWPLLAGRVIYRQNLTFPAAFRPPPRFALISSPAYLQHVPDLMAGASLRHGCRAIFSSGGPLGAETAARLRSQLELATIEVYGSTESGGIAWRRRDGGATAELWTPLPGVDLRPAAGSTALVRSPFVSASERTVDGEWFPLQDLVAFAGCGRFALQGRQDRVVKVEEKRIALGELEGYLAESALVVEAAVWLATQDGVDAGGRRAMLRAAVVPSPAGWTHLRESGRRQVSRLLREHLCAYVDPSLAPRHWRYVKRIPQDSQGKRSVETLDRLFDEAFDPRIVLPEIAGRSSAENRLVLELRVPEELRFFEGHFPGYPVVPGYVLLAWVLRFAAESFPLPARATRLRALKFHRVVKPGDSIAVSISWQAERLQLEFTIQESGSKVAGGRIQYGDASASEAFEVATEEGSGPAPFGRGDD